VDLEVPPGGISPTLVLALAIALAALMLVPVLPPVFNRLAHHLSLPFRDPSRPVPRLGFGHLLAGLGLGALGWVPMTLALACALAAVPGAGLPVGPASFAWLVAVLGVSYVAGFVILISPGAIGVREWFLTVLLTPEVRLVHDLPHEEARGKVALAVVLLRLAWTAAEVLLAAALYRARGRLP
jgi:hypothetical protein